ncbi:MAG: ATP-dependent RecD-like DNA helicase, partial [Muribaculaceae bacterium]|nr:ATP-dependent RecD-like DNA helicase [Muribaculaceae bacterium]
MKDTQEILSEKTTPEGIERFLASDFVEGIGPSYAHRLVEAFGTDTLRIIKDDPEKCSEIKGLGEARAIKASESLKAVKYPIPLLSFLFSCGISEMYIDRILGKYRKRTETVILKDPYYMVEDVWQLHFHTADKIGKKLGIAPDDPHRLQAAIVGAVKYFADDGHLFATVPETLEYASSMTGVSQDEIAKQIDATIDDGRIVRSKGVLYLPVFYNAEKDGAEKLLALAKSVPEKINVSDIPTTDGNGLTYSPMQIEAIKLLLSSPVSVLTGGPGSGKTTVLRAVIDVLEKEG